MTIKQQGGIFGRNPTFKNVSATDLNVSTLTATTANASTLTTTAAIIDNYVDIKSSGTVRGNIYADASNMYINTQGTNTNLNANGGNVVLGNANLVINTSGKGIDFSATSGTGTSELFDDYEEGDFAVTVTPGTSGSVTLNSSFDTGAYIKVGNLVTVTGFIAVSSVSSPAGLFKINLPITPAASTDRAADAAASVTMQNVVSANCADFLASVNENDPNLYIQLGDASTLQNDSAQQLQANTYIIFSATYRGA